jgi:radical SAM-linked protein
MQAEPVYKYRLTFSKGRRVKYIGHLDTVLSWTRAFRRAQLPMAYSKGFNPRARIQVAASLPLGYIGREELMDICLTHQVESNEILASVGSALPEGFTLLNVKEIDPKSPPMQNLLIQAGYGVTAETDLPQAELQQRIENLLAADEIIQTHIRRKKKRQKEEAYNLRPLLHHLALESVADGDARFTMRLSTGQNGHLRPEAVLQALGLGDIWHEVERLKLIFNC